MATLQIRKETNKVWKHVPSDALPYIVSKLYIKSDGDFIRVVEQGGSQRGQYNFADVSVYNIGGSAETFTSAQQLMERLEALNYIGFFYEGEVSPSELISSDVGNSIVLGTDGKLFSAGGGGGSTDWSDLTNFASLTPATTPLAGTEEIAIVQDGETKRVAVSNVGGGGGSKKSFTIEIPVSQTVAASTSWYVRNTITQNIFNATFTTTLAVPTNDFADLLAQRPRNIVPFDCKIKSVQMVGHTNSPATDIRVVILKSDKPEIGMPTTLINPIIIADKTFNTNSPSINSFYANWDALEMDLDETCLQGSEIRMLFFNDNVASNLYTTVCLIEFEEL
jgi:hypothetical protein